MRPGSLPTTAADAPFLEAIRAAPDDDSPRLVYADWLSERRDDDRAAALAEWIRDSVAVARLEPWTPEWLAARDRVDATPHAVLDAWRVPLARLGAVASEWRGGFVSRLEVPGDVYLQHWRRLAELAPGWTAITLRGAKSSLERASKLPLPPGVRTLDFTFADEPTAAGDGPIALATRRSLARAVAASPWLNRATSLSLWGDELGAEIESIVAALAKRSPDLTTLNLGANDLDAEIAEALARSPALGRLRSLDLRDNPLGDGLAALLDACRPESLRRLAFTAESRDDAAAIGDSPLSATLEELTVSGDDPRLEFASLFASPCAFPALKRLSLADSPGLSARDLRYARSDRPTSGVYFGALVELDLSGTRTDDAAIAALVESPLVDRLRSLDLAATRITDASAAALAASPRLHGLRRLRLDETRVTRAGMKLLRESPRLADLARLTR